MNIQLFCGKPSKINCGKTWEFVATGVGMGGTQDTQLVCIQSTRKFSKSEDKDANYCEKITYCKKITKKVTFLQKSDYFTF